MLAAGVGLGRVLAKPAAVSEPARQLAIDLPDSIRVAFRGNLDAPGGQGSGAVEQTLFSMDWSHEHALRLAREYDEARPLFKRYDARR